MNWFDKLYNRTIPSRFICFADGDSAPASGGTESSAPGGSPAPQAVPEGGVPGSPSSSDAGDADNDFDSAFGGMDDDLDSIEIGEEPSTGTVPGATPAPVPGATPPERAPAAATPPVSPQQPAPTATTPPVPSAPQSKREELNEAITGFKTGFDDLAKWATTELFTLPQETLDALATDAASVIPNLMAQTYTRSIMASLNFIKTYVPDMIAQEHARLGAAEKRTSEAANEFYSSWPDLNPKDHGAAMAQTAKVFRQLNPQATRKEAIDFVGRHLMTQFGITPTAQGAAPRRALPFQPARPGGHTPPVTPPKDPYAGLDQDFDVE
jgi:hypothetical protein